MAPDSGITRELYVSEIGTPIGTQLSDGFVVVSADVRHQLEVGRRELERRERRRRGRNVHPGRPF